MSETSDRGRGPGSFRGNGWRTIARKELADHLNSSRFIILLAVLGTAAAAAVYAASGGIREVAAVADNSRGLFLQLFTVTTPPVPFPFITFIGFLAPLLGIMFGFDAVNGERAQGTLPRLLSHPIHRDEVILGKFVAGLAVISTMIIALTAIVTGIGIFRIGVPPTAADITRLIVWLGVAVLYVGLWLGVAMLASVVTRRAATSALVVVSLWLVLVLFGPLLARTAAQAFSDDSLTVARLELALGRVSPMTVFDEASTVLLDPTQRVVGFVSFEQVDRALVSNLDVWQSIGVVWPQITLTVATTAALFAAAFIAFMRQEVRA